MPVSVSYLMPADLRVYTKLTIRSAVAVSDTHNLTDKPAVANRVVTRIARETSGGRFCR